MRFFLLSAFFISLLHAQETSALEGTVIDSTTGFGLPDVAVYFGSDAGPNYSAVTDSTGTFRISDMKDGQYGSHFEKPGYIPQFSGTSDSTLKPIRVAASQQPLGLRFALVPYATLAGRVFDPEGKPAKGATVTVGRFTEKTDDEGRFLIRDVNPGNYTLQARASDARTPSLPGGERTELLPTWFPSVIDSDQAETIAVHDGANLTAYDIHLKTAPVYRVRGVVLGTNGKPESRAVVYSTPVSAQSPRDSLINMGGVSMGTSGGGFKFGPLGYIRLSPSIAAPLFSEGGESTQDGIFELASVPRGARIFTAAIKQEDGPMMPVTATASVVVDHDIDNLQLRFLAPFNLEGSVEFAGASGAAPEGLVQQAAVALSGVPSRPVQPDGTLKFENINPGPYRIGAAPGLRGGYYLASVSIGDEEAMGKTINLQAGSPPLHIVYKPNAGTVAGTVDTGEGASVVLIPQAAVDATDVDYARVCRAAPGGSFEIDSVAPGTYYAFAVNLILPTQFANRRALKKFRNAATRILVSEGSLVSVKLTPIQFEE